MSDNKEKELQELAMMSFLSIALLNIEKNKKGMDSLSPTKHS